VALGGVLVVDDNRSFADFARGLLERQGERVLGTACTSAEDLALGDECGLDVAQLLAAGGDKAPVIIVISAYSPCDIAELIAASPAAGFLPKSDLSSDAIGQIVLNSRRRVSAGY
jgi:DNA-binding NarL/FixJ family response regulator